MSQEARKEIARHAALPAKRSARRGRVRAGRGRRPIARQAIPAPSAAYGMEVERNPPIPERERTQFGNFVPRAFRA
jgi:hypothetical protein